MMSLLLKREFFMEDIRYRFGQRLRMLRKQRGMSQEELALATGMDRTYISSVERGARNISLRNIEKIAQIFEVSLSELLEGI
jgi:transcriptional regulator with XRE-family HTH domain